MQLRASPKARSSLVGPPEGRSESIAGDSPTPDQSIVEENARAIGVSFEDNEELDFLDKIERRDRNRYELEEQSKTRDDSI